MEKDKVKEMMSIMEKNRNIHVLASSFEYIDENDTLIISKNKKGYSNHNFYNKEVKPDDIVQVKTDEFIYGNYFQGCALVMDKKTKDFLCIILMKEFHMIGSLVYMDHWMVACIFE